ncbi:MAG TPA: SRPBCC family protein [Chloroflexota bacterium]|nr:SRPBCC family protein [Chloroflexota bacterium]
MEFQNSFEVNAPIDRVWRFMTDPQQVTPCVPGAELTEIVDETHYKGTVKVKLGAVQMSYRGELEMQTDEAARTITLRARGTEARGSGGASGTVDVQLTSTADSGTRVEMTSQVDVTGRVAQFGRGIMQDVANRIIKQFVGCLESRLHEQCDGSQGDAPESPQLATEAADASQASAAATQAEAGTPTAVPDTTRPAVPPATSAGAAELRVVPLMIGVARSRAAAALRGLASLIEPR